MICRRFLKRFNLHKANAHTYGYKTASHVIWVEWTICKAGEHRYVAIGKNVTCLKKFKPIIKDQNKILRLRNKIMVESIKYAQSIQQTLLPHFNLLSSIKDYFIIYEPKDIVSGDFYWFYQRGDLLFIAAIDCTGHGVPGALMTVLTNTLLNGIIKQNGLSDPAEMLSQLDDQLKETLLANNRMINDGLDIALCQINWSEKVLTFSGAFQNVILVQNLECKKIKGSRFPIGNYPCAKMEFVNQRFNLTEGDRFYLCSDGYQDQFGGPDSMKIGSKKVLSLLSDNQYLSLDEQKKLLETHLKSWQGKEYQIDDILFMGFEV